MSPRARACHRPTSRPARRLLTALGIAVITAGCGDGDATSDAAVEAAGSGGTHSGSGGIDAGEGGRGEPTAGATAEAGASGVSGDAGASGTECNDDGDCVAPGECFSVTCDDGSCVGAVRGRGSVCAAGFCNEFARCLPCLDEAEGRLLDPGCSAVAPICAETEAPVECIGCRNDADCDDGISCTVDDCKDAACEHAVLPAGASCADGVCDGEANADSCVPCLDDVSAGMDRGCTKELPRCDTERAPPECSGCETAADCNDGNECTGESCNDGVCEYATIVSGTPCFGGYCNGVAGAEICIPKQCENDSSCSDGVACTAEVCGDSHLCVYTPDHAQCPDSGDVCRRNICSVGIGCQAIDVSQSLELLDNGNFEAGNVDWVELSSNYPQVIFLFDYVPTLRAHTESGIAWLGGGEGPVDEHNSLSQVVSVPAATVQLELSFFYQIWSDDLPDDQNYLTLRLRSNDVNEAGEELVTFHNQDEIRVWTRFTQSLDVSRWAGSEMTLEFAGASVDGYTAFFIDTVSLSATVCE
jgi:hypothetical protein